MLLFPSTRVISHASPNGSASPKPATTQFSTTGTPVSATKVDGMMALKVASPAEVFVPDVRLGKGSFNHQRIFTKLFGAVLVGSPPEQIELSSVLQVTPLSFE